MERFTDDYIINKFDLTKSYIVDGNSSKIIMNEDYKIDFEALKGETLTFKKLVEATQVEGLWKIFTNKPAHLRGFIDDVNPISLNKFLQGEK